MINQMICRKRDYQLDDLCGENVNLCAFVNNDDDNDDEDDDDDDDNNGDLIVR